MQIVVPLAGPDFIQPDGSLKPLTPVNGQPLLQYVLASRPWAKNAAPEDYTFILYDGKSAREFVKNHLEIWFPGARYVYISDYTQGAALSAAVGVASRAGQASEPLVIDLADVYYTCTTDPLLTFTEHPECGGVALVFQSDNPAYSYLRTNEAGEFVEAAEKRVISKNASAGTYIFSDAKCFLQAIVHALETPETQTHRGLFFVCPLFNGVRAQKRSVQLHSVTDVKDIKIENL